jgi:hypothetical protein
MKSLAPFLIVIATIFSFKCSAQFSGPISINKEMTNAQLLSDSISNNQLRIVGYHVVERINMKFGGTITTYDVSSLSLVNTNDLGQENSRTITPKYSKSKEKIKEVLAVTSIPIKASANALHTINDSIKVIPKKKLKYADIDIIGTYERVIDRGYKTVDMLKRVGNSRFFGGDLVTAAKWYSQLFSLTTDLEAEYYYRYAQTLNSISEPEKAKEMMHIFESKK